MIVYEVNTILNEQRQIIINTIKKWLTFENIEQLLAYLAITVLALVSTFLIIKILSFFLDRLLKKNDSQEEDQEDESQREEHIISDNFIQSMHILLKTLLLYGGYFVAAILILETFNVQVITPEDLKSLGTSLLKIIGILVGAKLVINLGHITIKQIFEKREFKDDLFNNHRAQTLEVLLRSVFTYMVFFLAGLTILQIFNVNISAILASAGVLGIAVGFGAQSLVKDIISGFFIFFENLFNVEDFVETAGVTGTVEEIGLRTCKIRQWTGQLHIIPNGQITQVTNYNRGPMLALITVSIAYEEDIDQAISALKQECEIAFREIPSILDIPQVQGVTELAESSVNIRTIAPAAPNEHWYVERELLRRFKYALDRNNIEIPYPRQVLHFRNENKDTEKERL